MAFANDVISLDDLKLHIHEENEREETIRAQLMAESSMDKMIPKLSKQDVMTFAKSKKENWPHLELDHKKVIMQTVFSRIVTDIYDEAVGGPGRRAACKNYFI
ncbi:MULTISPECIES: hypothetical protein [unclassified Brevibacillus]|uniref:hypothetical protein n=1 Tax=unclassified Brevibacillus TaxID=2684853 RepID=UPI00356A9BFD